MGVCSAPQRPVSSAPLQNWSSGLRAARGKANIGQNSSSMGAMQSSTSGRNSCHPCQELPSRKDSGRWQVTGTAQRTVGDGVDRRAESRRAASNRVERRRRRAQQHAACSERHVPCNFHDSVSAAVDSGAAVCIEECSGSVRLCDRHAGARGGNRRAHQRASERIERYGSRRVRRPSSAMNGAKLKREAQALSGRGRLANNQGGDLSDGIADAGVVESIGRVAEKGSWRHVPRDSCARISVRHSAMACRNERRVTAREGSVAQRATQHIGGNESGQIKYRKERN